jgi:hypothetical protein
MLRIKELYDDVPQDKPRLSTLATISPPLPCLTLNCPMRRVGLVISPKKVTPP